MSKPVFLIGGGGHGRVVLDALLSRAAIVTGIVDPKLKVGDRVLRVPVLGGDEYLDQVDPKAVSLINGLGVHPYVRERRKLFEVWTARGFSFDAVRHTSAVIGLECDLGEGSQVMAGAVLQNQVRIGKNAVINTRASIDHNCVVDTHAFVAPGVVLCGDVLVGNSAFIGAGAVVLPHVEVGTDAVIGAGAVVIENVPDGWIVAGNPAVKIGMNE